MIIPEIIEKRKQMSSPFERIRILFDTCINFEDQLDTLSMGMSDDYKIAIQNGSNMIRIGTLLFGKRRF